MNILKTYYLTVGLVLACLVFSIPSIQAQTSPATKPSNGIDIMITQSPKIVVKLEGVTHNVCNDESKGAINISAFGGFPPYQYYWSNGDTTQDVAGLKAGTYRVAVYDNFSCSDTLEVAITEPTPLVGQVESITDILCYGYNNGAVDISVSGGTPPYQFRWSNGSTDEDLTGVNSGRFSVLITDANHCQEIVTADVLEKPLIVRSIDHVDNIKCNGEQTGSIDITVEGGVPPYSFSWSTGQTTEDISNLPAGEYTVTVTDSQGCTEISSTKVIEPDELIVGFDQVKHLQCNGDSGGAINIFVKGGKGPFTYEWSNGAITQDIAGIAAGDYSVNITDAYGCTNAISTTITEPETLVLNLDNAENISFKWGTNGSLDISVVGGTPPYRYNWSDGSTSQDISNLAAGTYTVRVTDAGGCANIMNTTLTEPDQLKVVLDKVVNVSCAGDKSGQVYVSVYGGIKPYQYLWSNGAGVEDLTNLPAGAYTLTVTDGKGYQQSINAEINEPETFAAELVAVTDILCHGESTGAVDISASGGVPPYRYRWSNGEISQDLESVPAGAYSVKILDANNCELELNTKVTQPEDLAVTLDGFSPVSCAGDTSGTIDISVVGGAKPYTYQWNNGMTNEDPRGLGAGIYQVVIVDNNGCSVELEQEITEPAVLALDETSVLHADCHGSYTGAIELAISGGVTPYAFQWSSGETTLSIGDKSAGVYSLMVTDANGCTATYEREIQEPPLLVCKVAEVSHNSCFNERKGTIDIEVTGGVAPYQYQWSTGATTQDVSGLNAGKYMVSIIDANGCTDTLRAEVTENPLLEAKANVTNILCQGMNTGAIDLEVSGGVKPYSFAWSNEATTQNISALTSGNYSVVITDAAGCVRSVDARVSEPTRFVATLQSEQHLKCFEEHTGAIQVKVTGGVEPYKFSWSNGATTQNISQLPKGEYTLTATDANGCVQTVSTSLTQPPKINYEVKSVTDVSCYGAKEGAIDILVSGGVGPFTYRWNNGATTQDIHQVPAGSYDVTIVDANGCMNTLSAEINQPDLLTVQVDSVSHILCNGEPKGAVEISVAGGVKPYTYSWSNGSTTEDIGGVSAGEYQVTVMDAQGCSKTVNATIREPQPLQVRIAQVKDIACFGDARGAVMVEVAGGVKPYTYQWSNGNSSQNIVDVAAGTYSVVITDQNGCSKELSATIKQPAKLVSELISTHDISCYSGTDGSIDVMVLGGVTPYAYSWNNGATSQDLNNVPAGNYALTIQDANGCQDMTIATALKQPTLLEAGISGITHIDKYGEHAGAIDVTVSGGVAPYIYSWSNGHTKEDLKKAPGGNYSVQIVDQNGCERELTASINQPPALVLKLESVTDVLCNGAETGSVQVNVTGGKPPYVFAWTNGDSTQNIQDVSAGSYTLTVTDISGYSKSITANITEPSELVGKIDSYQNILCHNMNTGEINVTVTGGVAPYSFKWNTGQTTEDIAGLSAGNYTLTVMDQAGCEIQINQAITEPEPFEVTLAEVNHVLCKGDASGEINLNVKGGVQPYTYVWSNGARTRDISNVLAGRYDVLVTDANGCSVSIDATLNEPALLYAEVKPVKHNTCYGEAKGAISLGVHGGMEPYTFEWSSGDSVQNLTDLEAGDYSVLITDANGCSKSLQATVTDPELLEASITKITQVKCQGNATGLVDVMVSGGTLPYSYTWSDGSTSQDLKDVGAGTYELSVIDGGGCRASLTAVVTEPESLTVSVDQVHDILCHGEQKGMVDVRVSGGVRPYKYTWSNGAVSEDLVDVLAGEYTLRVRDAMGCVANLSAVVNEPAMLTLSPQSITDIQCFGQKTGAALMQATGGIAPYKFAWSNGATGPQLEGVGAGEYTATLTDGNGCQASYTLEIKQPAELIKTIDAITDIRCSGDSTGSIYVSVFGGEAPYQFSWSNGATTEDIRGLTQGSYTLTITEANGCQSVLEANIEEPPMFETSIASVTDVKCFGDTTGAIGISVDGGVAPYNFIWSNGAKTKDLQSVNADSYSVMVTDGNGCIKTLYADIEEPPALRVNIDSVRNVKCCGDDSGAIFITASGGVTPYKYQWSNGATNEDIENLILGVYTVNVFDANGCVVASNDEMTLYEQVLSKGKFTTRDILFDVGKSIIKPESFLVINKIASFMKEHEDISFRIDGHTDSDGSDELNQRLSEDRANAIRLALIKFGIRPNRLATRGFGESEPVATNETAEGKAFNRRVEFIALTGTRDGTLIENEMEKVRASLK